VAEIISPPIGLGANSMEPLTGPRTVRGGATESIGGFTQSFASAFGLWRWRFSFPAMNGSLLRDYRGWITALHGGANATRWHFFDPDMLTFAEAGVTPSNFQIATGMPWSNDEPWANSRNWAVSRPDVAVAAAATLGSTTVVLSDDWWGHALGRGSFIGFYPYHFGLYEITKVLDEPGRYRVWPPLRKAITTSDFATLDATLALRLEGEAGAPVGRGLAVAEGLTATFVEVLDYDVRDYFAD